MGEFGCCGCAGIGVSVKFTEFIEFTVTHHGVELLVLWVPLVVLPDHTNKKARAIIPWPCDALKGGALPVLLWLYTYVTVLIS